jgi:alpha-tubulin suppressor-like RCC1 family protein
MGLLTGHCLAGARRRGWTLILAAVIAALFLSAASSAHAANVVKAWGLNTHGQLGDGTTEGPEKCAPFDEACSTVPVAVSGLSGVNAVSAGSDHPLALLENGTVMAWGRGGQGQLGNGKENDSDVPVGVCEVGYSGETPCSAQHYLKGVVAIASDQSSFSVALLEDGTVVDWGEIPFAKLGDGTTARSSVPVHVCEVGYAGETPCTAEHYLKGVTAITTGSRFALALLGSGGVAAWGESATNSGSVFGDGTGGSGRSQNVPTAVCAVNESAPCAQDLSGVSEIAAGGTHALALISGSVVAWGENHFGELGDGNTTNTNSPVNVTGLSGVTAISAGRGFSLALKAGTAEAWGDNTYAQLGTGSNNGPEQCGETLTFPCSTVPVAVHNLTGVTTISAGSEHSLAILQNGSVVAWGRNDVGQLGDATNAGPEPCEGAVPSPCAKTPVPVSTGDAIVKGISSGERFSLAFGSPSAPAGLPEAGRCVKVATGTGTYSSGTCLTPAKRESAKKYEWVPASLTEKQAFSGSGLEPTLTTAGHSTVKCINANLSGEWTGPKTANVSVQFQGCITASGAQCQSVAFPPTKSEITFNGVLGELGYIKYEEVEGKLKVAVGLDLKPQPPMTSLTTYECTGSGEHGHIEGSVIGKLTPINQMTTKSNLLYFATKSGEQRPEYFQGSPKDTLTTSFTSGPAEESKGSGVSSLNIKEYKGENAAPLEIKTR